MKRMLSSISIAVATLAVPIIPAHTAGPYDGTWQFSAPPAGNSSTSDVAACDGVQLQVQVKDNQIQGTLARAAYGGARVTQTGPGQTPITGTVQPDGTLNAQWQSYQITGKLAGDKGELRWSGQCGTRVAAGGRMAPEAAGSSTR